MAERKSFKVTFKHHDRNVKIVITVEAYSDYEAIGLAATEIHGMGLNPYVPRWYHEVVEES